MQHRRTSRRDAFYTCNTTHAPVRHARSRCSDRYQNQRRRYAWLSTVRCQQLRSMDGCVGSFFFGAQVIKIGVELRRKLPGLSLFLHVAAPVKCQTRLWKPPFSVLDASTRCCAAGKDGHFRCPRLQGCATILGVENHHGSVQQQHERGSQGREGRQGVRILKVGQIARSSHESVTLSNPLPSALQRTSSHLLLPSLATAPATPSCHPTLTSDLP